MAEEIRPPKTPEQLVAALSEDLKMIGGYLLDELHKANFSLQMREQELKHLIDNPEEAALDVEERNESLGLSRQEKKEEEDYELSEDNLADEVRAAVMTRDEFAKAIRDLSESSFAGPLEILNRHLFAQEFLERTFPNREKLSPAYREREDARTRALRTYTDILKRK